MTSCEISLICRYENSFCNKESIEHILEENSRYWKQICDDFWVFANYKDDFDDLNIAPPEYYMNEIERLLFLNDNARAFIGSAKILDNERQIDFMCPQAVLDELLDPQNSYADNL